MHEETVVGFIGLGTMGEPMARNLVRFGRSLVVWNRSAQKCAALASDGAKIAANRDAVFRQCQIVILMLADASAMDEVLARGTRDFTQLVSGHTIISMGTFTPEYSLALAQDITAAGGRYVEAPVSGSRKPAEAGALIGMLAGETGDTKMTAKLLKPMFGESFICGAVPSALKMKLAVNVFLITMVTGLAEAFHFAGRHGLDLEQYTAILNAGPMASAVSRIKSEKMATRNFDRQAGISDVLKNSRLIVHSAHAAGIPAPLMEASLALYGEAQALGSGCEDMVAVIKALETRTEKPV